MNTKRIIFLLIIIVFGTFVASRIDKAKHFHPGMYYFDNKDFFDQSVKSFENLKPLSPPPRIFIVNQHILAAHIIARQFALSSDPNVKHVILLTQNNWNVGKSPIITSKYLWKTTLGNIEPATSIANTLINKKIVKDEEGIFTREHGVTGIVPYIAHSFPNADFIPLVISDTASDTVVDNLARELSVLDLTDTVIIASIDMSHYLPQYIADIHDRFAVQTIRQFDYENLNKLDIDTVPALRAILKIAESFGLQKFTQTNGINSAEIVGDPDLMITTSYVSGYFTEGQKEKKDGTIYILFMKDVEIDHNLPQYQQDRLFLGNHIVFGKNDESKMATIQGKDICLINKKGLPNIKCDYVFYLAKEGNEIVEISDSKIIRTHIPISISSDILGQYNFKLLEK